MIIAILRSAVISGSLLFVLPLLFGIQGVWLAMPVSELVVAIIALVYIQYSETNIRRLSQHYERQ